MDSAHHTTSVISIHYIAICAERYWGKSSIKLSAPENRHFWDRVRDTFQIRFPIPGRHRKYGKYLRGVPGQNDQVEGRWQKSDAL